jgi:hypothetical protein
MTFDFGEYFDEAHMLRHCAPVFFIPAVDSKPSEIVANGTIALLDTGEKLVLMTCNHVLDAFHEYKQKQGTGCLCTVFDGYVRRPIVIDENTVIDADQGVDLAVFPAFPQSWPMGTKEFYRVERWPIPKAKVGDPISFIGFPGNARVTTDALGNFQYSSFGLTVSDVSDRKFVIRGDGPDRGRLEDNDGNLIQPIALRGMSGSPAYVRDKRAGFQLAGFVQMGDSSSDDLFFTHASVLNRDGSLRK